MNRETGAYLHRMQWAADDEIGEIPVELELAGRLERKAGDRHT